jgi:hypothetical protein
MRVHIRSNMLEELLDDQEDIGDINLSSRPMREEGRRQRDREALEREVRRHSHATDHAQRCWPKVALLPCWRGRHSGELPHRSCAGECLQSRKYLQSNVAAAHQHDKAPNSAEMFVNPSSIGEDPDQTQAWNLSQSALLQHRSWQACCAIDQWAWWLILRATVPSNQLERDQMERADEASRNSMAASVDGAASIDVASPPKER